MKINRLGEFELIEQIRRQFAGIPSPGCEGIGDDCAVIPVTESEALVVTTDMLVEDIHFLRDRITPYELGCKSLAVNLSDVAAMGARPCGSFLSVALPVSTDTEWINAFLSGYHSLSETFSVPLLGGDTTASPDRLTISVTAIGRIALTDIKRRSAAQEDDKIFVTGTLGGSAQGLIDIKAGHGDTLLAKMHNNPKPYVNEGIWLGRQSSVHAMTDISDGLASDLLHILQASGCSAEVTIEKIPANSSIKLAVTGGEDYRLLCTVDSRRATEIAENYRREFGEPLYEIGAICKGEPAICWKENGVVATIDWKGFTHF